jgi:transposase
MIACTPEQCVCGNCGRNTTVTGYEVSEVLDVEPARHFVQVIKREKRACKTGPEQGVAAAPLPARIIDKSLVSDRVIINTVVNKFTANTAHYSDRAWPCCAMQASISAGPRCAAG